jgi:hypothetical protein
MDKEHLMHMIEKNKGDYGFEKDLIYNAAHTAFCTMGLLMKVHNTKRYDVVMVEYNMNSEDLDWLVHKNSRCNSFDDMIEAIRNYKQSE